MRFGLLARDRQRELDVLGRPPCLRELVAQGGEPVRRLGVRAVALGLHVRDLRAGGLAQLVERATRRRARLLRLALGLGEHLGHLATRRLACPHRRQLELGGARLEVLALLRRGVLELGHAGVECLAPRDRRLLQLREARLGSLAGGEEVALGCLPRGGEVGLGLLAGGALPGELLGGRLPRRVELAGGLGERGGQLAADPLALDRDRALELSHARIGVLARLPGDRLRLFVRLCERHLGLLVRPRERRRGLLPGLRGRRRSFLLGLHERRSGLLPGLRERRRSFLLGLHKRRSGLLPGLRNRRLGLRLRTLDRRVGLLARQRRHRRRLLAGERRRRLGRLERVRRQLGRLARLRDLRLDLRHPRVGLAGHAQQGTLGLARPAPGPLELLRQLGGARGQLALGAFALCALLVEALRPAPAGLVDEPGRLLAGLCDLRGGVGARLRRGSLGRLHARLGRRLRLCRGALGLARPRLERAGARPRCVDRPGGLGQALLQLLLAGAVARLLRPQLGELGLERSGPGDLAGPRGGLLVEAARQQRRLLTLAITLGAHAADLASDP